MNLRLHTRDVGEATVVEVGGEVELYNAPQLRGQLWQACERDHPRVIVDLSGVTFIDSTGVGVLVGALKRAREHQGNLVLVCPEPSIRRIFEITGLQKALPLFESREAALAACAEESPVHAATIDAATIDATTGGSNEG